MLYTTARIENTYVGLQGSLNFLGNQLETLSLKNGGHNARSIESVSVSDNIERIKKVLEVVKEGIEFFEKNWIFTKGKKKGQVKKFQWWNPVSWSLLGKSAKYYADMSSRIVALYSDNSTT